MSESSEHVMQRSVMACGGGGMRNGYLAAARCTQWSGSIAAAKRVNFDKLC